MDGDPYRIEGPALISFSGGRTSAYLLQKICQAFDGQLPDDVRVSFANVGKEDEKTLRFVHECGVRFGCDITWLEWRPHAEDVERARQKGCRPEVMAWLEANQTEDRFAVVGYNSASRNGEPYSGLIACRGHLPNPQDRFCSITLKIHTMDRHTKNARGWDHWTSIIGLRHDEGYRCMKAYARNASKKDRYRTAVPLDKAKVTEADVLTHWLGPTMRVEDGVQPQGFDLGLHSYRGNCDLCFLKRRAKRAQVIRDDPAVADWWIREEATSCATNPTSRQFRMDETVADLVASVRAQPLLPLFDDADDEHDVECGLLCEPDEAA